jgi:hypothetical protein
MMHQSIATISSPEFINLQPLDINPLMSKCEIKVLYLGENRNHSYITKEVATDMAKSLRGAPIVGYYKEEKEDFADHGQQIIMDDEGIKFKCMTRPYGFVAPDAQVWFQEFEDTDDFGNKINREYLMTTGYLWTGQYEEVKSVMEAGKPQSMELDEDTLEGHWSTNVKTGMDFFIINDAIFSKLCILGDDVEPCFEGASVTAPQVSSSFSKVDDGFKQTLFTMMQDLKFALEGGKNMELEDKTVVETENNEVETVVEETVVETENSTEVAEPTQVETTFEDSGDSGDGDSSSDSSEGEGSEDSTDTENGEENGEDTPSTETDSDEDNSNDEEDDEEEEDNSDDVSKKRESYSLEEYAQLETAYSELESKYNALVEFKNTIENEKKEALINSFYMLSDEDKKDVKEHMAEYSLEDIEAKLSVICVRKKVNFDLEDSAKNDNKVEEENNSDVTTFSLNETGSVVPAWISALRHTQNSKKN